MVGGYLIAWVLAVVFIATLIRTAFGFGEALVAVPLLALVVPVEIAAPLAVLVSVTVAAIVMLEDWHQVHLSGAWRLIVSTLFGIPVGLLLLIAVAGSVVKIDQEKVSGTFLKRFLTTFSAYLYSSVNVIARTSITC